MSCLDKDRNRETVKLFLVGVSTLFHCAHQICLIFEWG